MNYRAASRFVYVCYVFRTFGEAVSGNGRRCLLAIYVLRMVYLSVFTIVISFHMYIFLPPVSIGRYVSFSRPSHIDETCMFLY